MLQRLNITNHGFWGLGFRWLTCHAVISVLCHLGQNKSQEGRFTQRCSSLASLQLSSWIFSKKHHDFGTWEVLIVSIHTEDLVQITTYIASVPESHNIRLPPQVATEVPLTTKANLSLCGKFFQLLSISSFLPLPPRQISSKKPALIP